MNFSLYTSHGCTVGMSPSVYIPFPFQEGVVDAHLALLPLMWSRSIYPFSGLGWKTIDTLMKITCIY